MDERTSAQLLQQLEDAFARRLPRRGCTELGHQLSLHCLGVALDGDTYQSERGLAFDGPEVVGRAAEGADEAVVSAAQVLHLEGRVDRRAGGASEVDVSVLVVAKGLLHQVYPQSAHVGEGLVVDVEEPRPVHLLHMDESLPLQLADDPSDLLLPQLQTDGQLPLGDVSLAHQGVEHHHHRVAVEGTSHRSDESLAAVDAVLERALHPGRG